MSEPIYDILKVKDNLGIWHVIPALKGNRGNGIASLQFSLDGTLTITDDDGEVTTYTGITSALAAIGTKEQEIDAAELSRVLAEQTRAGAEEARQNSETIRRNAETVRNADEALRRNAESARDAAELQRASAESTRQENEATRQSNENSRQDAEAARAAAETSRATAETERATAETARQAAETARESAEEDRETLYDQVSAMTADAETLAPGSSATATKQTDTQGNINFHFGIPRGTPGDVPAASIAPVEATATASKAYAAGDYFWRNGTLYAATDAIAAGGTITVGTNCRVAVVGEDLGNLKSAVDSINDRMLEETDSTNYWEINAWKISDGSATGNSKRIRTKSSVIFPNGLDYIIHSDAGVLFYVVFYNDDGYVPRDEYPFVEYADVKSIAPEGATKFRLVARTDPESVLTGRAAEIGAKVHIYHTVFDKIEDEIDSVRQEYFTGKDLLSWYLGYTRNTSTGEMTASNAATYATTELIGASPLGAVEYTGDADDDEEIPFVISCYEYGIDRAFIKNTTLGSTEIILTNNTYYVAFRFGRANATGITIKYTDIQHFDVKIKQSKSGAIYTDLVNAEQERQKFLQSIGYIQMPPMRMGSRKPSGEISSSVKTATNAVPFTVESGGKIKILIKSGWIFTLYGRNNSSESYNVVKTGEEDMLLEINYTSIFFNIIRRDGLDIDVNGAQTVLVLFYSNESANSGSIEKHDVPKNLGVINTLLNAKQMLNIKYTPTASMPQQSGDFPAGEEKTGMVYSSTRAEELFVPQTVSFDSFMTAVKNPNSYLYTRQSLTSNSKTYYGCVCSTFVGHCYGIRNYIPTTYQLGTIPGMEEIEDQSAYGLELGDMLLKYGSHAMIVIDILRNTETGYIKNVKIAEAWHPVCRTRTFTPSSLKSNVFNDGYVAYRYKPIYGVTYIPSPWVNLNEEIDTPIYSTHLSPRRGENANWRKNETVEIDILDSGEYTQYKLYKGDTLISTETIPVSALISLQNLPYGKYKVCLTDGSNDSEFVYFLVVDNSETYTANGNGTVVCEFASENAQPTSLSWNYDPDTTGNKSYVIFRTDMFTNEEISEGRITCTEEPGTYYLRVTYKTEYGLYYSDVQKVIVT